jgi:hypothetical protein
VLELGKRKDKVGFSKACRNLLAKPFGPPGHAFIQCVEVRGDRAFHQTEMGKIKFGRIQLPDFGNGFMPGFDVQLRWNKRWNGRAVSEPDTGDIASEQIIFPMINMMMTGMAWRGDGADFELADLNDVLVLQNSDTFFPNRRDLAPQSLHVVAEDAARGCDQFGGIDEMLSATGMNINRGPKLGESPGRTGMVKMDMTEEDMLNIVSGSTKLPQRGDNSVKG